MADCDEVSIVIIPGNPGVKEYYHEFMDKLGDELKLKSIPCKISTVSHIGHSDELHDKDYSLHDQINHHKAKISRVQSKNIILIGHSIGCYIILKLLEHSGINSRVSRVFLLFPTIETLSETPKGKSVAYLLRSLFFRWLIVLLAKLLATFTTANIRRKLINWYLGKELHPMTIAATMTVMMPHVVRQVLYMAKTEMEVVREMTVECWRVIENISNKTVMYYGQKDHWCPIEMCDAMRQRYASADLPVDNVRLDNENMEHAFVLSHSATMAKICASLM